MLLGIFERCDSAREVCDGMAALGGKLNYLGMDAAPAKSTFNDTLINREASVFEQFYFALIDYFSEVLSDCRKEGISFEKFYAFDSTTISLFSDVLKGVGRNPKGDGKKKRGLKVHMLTDVHADTAKFVKISEAKQHDKDFLKHLILPPGSMIAFDKAYNHYLQFAKWTTGKTYYTHKRLRSAYLSLKRYLSYLFVCQDYKELMIPNTTNTLDGQFSDLKNKLRNHNGVSKVRKMKFIDGFFKA